MSIGANAVTEVIKKRRTIHHFKPDKIPESIILKAIELSVYAPNHHLNAAVRFRLISDSTKECLLTAFHKFLMEKNPESAELKINKWRQTPGWLLVTQVKSAKEMEAKEDYATIACALYIMMLDLEAQGIGSKWSTGPILFTKEWRAICGLDEQEEVVGLFWYGYAETIPEMPQRKNIYQQIIRI